MNTTAPSKTHWQWFVTVLHRLAKARWRPSFFGRPNAARARLEIQSGLTWLTLGNLANLVIISTTKVAILNKMASLKKVKIKNFYISPKARWWSSFFGRPNAARARLEIQSGLTWLTLGNLANLVIISTTKVAILNKMASLKKVKIKNSTHYNTWWKQLLKRKKN